MPDFDAQHLALGLTNYLVLLFSLSFHESAHAWTALKLGDDTAASLGRITLNPLPHIDIFGTVLMPLLQIFGGFSLLGWAKPTPYDPRRFRGGVSLSRGHIYVALAGPASNFILTILFTVLFAITIHSGLPRETTAGIENIFRAGVLLNVSLMIFNMLPVPPLDGSHILSWSLPRNLGEKFDHVAENYGTLILFALFFTGLLGMVMGPPQQIVLGVIERLIS